MRHPANIAFCITGLEGGGAERNLVELATRLPRERFSSWVISLAPPPSAPDDLLCETLAAAGVPVVYLGARHPLQAPWILRMLARALRANRPQILQCMLLSANAVGAVAGRLAGVPHVLAGIRVAERRPRGHLWLARRTARWVERHVCVSQSVADFTARRGGLPAESLVVIPSGVDMGVYSSANAADLVALGLPAGRRAILFVGRLNRQKGIDWLLDRAPEFLALLPDHDLLVVGRGPCQQSLARKAAALNVRERVHFAGGRHDVPQILAASDLVVLPSRWEGMPRVLLEAMASGKPVVSTDVEGVRELIGQENAADQIVPVGDSASFCRAVIGILSDDSLADRLGRENRARVEGNFTVERMVDAYQQLYESLLDD